MRKLKLSVESDPPARDVKVLTDELVACAETRGLSPDARPLAVFLRDHWSEVVGGVYGATYWGLFWVQLVWVEESLRDQGHGTELMRAAEQEALARGCHLARVETFAPESLHFYQRLGYEVFGKLEGHPPGHTTYFMKKSDLRKWGRAPDSVTADASQRHAPGRE